MRLLKKKMATAYYKKTVGSNNGAVRSILCNLVGILGSQDKGVELRRIRITFIDGVTPSRQQEAAVTQKDHICDYGTHIKVLIPFSYRSMHIYAEHVAVVTDDNKISSEMVKILFLKEIHISFCTE